MSNVVTNWNKILDNEFAENFFELYDAYSESYCYKPEDYLVIEFQYRINGDNLYVKVTNSKNAELYDTLGYMNASLKDETETPEKLVQSLYDNTVARVKHDVMNVSKFDKMDDAFTRDGFRVLQIEIQW